MLSLDVAIILYILIVCVSFTAGFVFGYFFGQDRKKLRRKN